MENAVIQTAIDILANNQNVSANTSIFDVAIEIIKEFHRQNNNTTDTSNVIKDALIRGPITMNMVSDYIDPADKTLKEKKVLETTITPQYTDADKRPFDFNITDTIDGVIDYSDAINRANMKISSISDTVEDAKHNVAAVVRTP
jgi:hypothetical protein